MHTDMMFSVIKYWLLVLAIKYCSPSICNFTRSLSLLQFSCSLSVFIETIRIILIIMWPATGNKEERTGKKGEWEH